MGKKRGRKSTKKLENTGKEKSIQKKDIKEKKSDNNIKDKQVEKIQDSLNLVKKRVAISYKKLKDNHFKRIEDLDINNLTLENLKIIASNFDLDPLINFRLLSLLKNSNISEYNKYIIKYKYTLNYEDANKLKCFKDNEEEIKKECFNNFGEKIDNIKSLSKLKIFNFLFFIMKFECNYWKIVDEYESIGKEIKDGIKLYENELDLVFKVPNNLGNYELQYYTYLGLFIDYFSSKIIPTQGENENKINSNDINENSEIDQNDLYFDWDNNNHGELEEIDMSEFEEKRNNLKNFIDKYLEDNSKINDNNINMEVEEGSHNIKNKNVSPKEKNDSNNDLNHKSEMDIVIDFIKIHVPKLKIYKSELNKLVTINHNIILSFFIKSKILY